MRIITVVCKYSLISDVVTCRNSQILRNAVRNRRKENELTREND